MEDVSPVAARVIAKFDGPDKFAAVLGISVTQAYRMTYARSKGGTGGIIHPKYHPQLFAGAREKGIDLTAADLVDQPADRAGAAQPGTDIAPETGVNWGDIMDRTIASIDADAAPLRDAFAAAVAGLHRAGAADLARVSPKLEAILRGEAGRVWFIITAVERPTLVWTEPMAEALRAIAEGRLSDGEETLDALLTSEAA